jgi:CRP-like cAMP-binding protein
MSLAVESPATNFLIQGLAREDRERLLAAGEIVQLALGDVLCDSDQPYRQVYFPLSAYISLVTKLTDHRPLVLALVGNEGMLGASLALGIGDAPMRAVVQGAGSAWGIGNRSFRRELGNSPRLTLRLHRYLYVQLGQFAQAVACTRFHQIEPRLSRWLLLTHDRAQSDRFNLTHEFLADMLGVRRSGITIAAGALQARGLISYSRGTISILDRAGLEAASCECYRAQQRQFARIFLR